MARAACLALALLTMVPKAMLFAGSGSEAPVCMVVDAESAMEVTTQRMCNLVEGARVRGKRNCVKPSSNARVLKTASKFDLDAHKSTSCTIQGHCSTEARTTQKTGP